VSIRGPTQSLIRPARFVAHQYESVVHLGSHNVASKGACASPMSVSEGEGEGEGAGGGDSDKSHITVSSGEDAQTSPKKEQSGFAGDAEVIGTIKVEGEDGQQLVHSLIRSRKGGRGDDAVKVEPVEEEAMVTDDGSREVKERGESSKKHRSEESSKKERRSESSTKEKSEESSKKERRSESSTKERRSESSTKEKSEESSKKERRSEGRKERRERWTAARERRLGSDSSDSRQTRSRGKKGKESGSSGDHAGACAKESGSDYSEESDPDSGVVENEVDSLVDEIVEDAARAHGAVSSEGHIHWNTQLIDLVMARLRAAENFVGIEQRVEQRLRDRTCAECGRLFKNKQNCKVHQRQHTGDKPYLCDVCGKSFSQSGSMRRHRANVHKIPDSDN